MDITQEEILFRLSRLENNIDRMERYEIRTVIRILSEEIIGTYESEFVYLDYTDTANGICKFCGRITDDNVDSVTDICSGCSVEMEEFFDYMEAKIEG